MDVAVFAGKVDGVAIGYSSIFSSFSSRETLFVLVSMLSSVTENVKTIIVHQGKKISLTRAKNKVYIVRHGLYTENSSRSVGGKSI